MISRLSCGEPASTHYKTMHDAYAVLRYAAYILIPDFLDDRDPRARPLEARRSARRPERCGAPAGPWDAL